MKFHSPETQKNKDILFAADTTDKIDSIKVIPDSLLLKKDTLTIKNDTVKVDKYAQDSTARIENFHYQRNPLPVTTLGSRYIPPFYAQPSQGMITRTVQIDSTGKYVLIKEEINGIPYKTLLRLPLDEYIQMQLAANQTEDWKQLGKAYELKATKKELGQLIKNITNFEIPLPSVGVLSIFGAPKISLRIGGAIDIHGAWRNETTQGITTSFLGNTRNEPDFRQTVQVNVDGTIGDKLNIKADWNTERTFQYENQLKIKYTGYEDEIVQSVEAGNVSLQTSPLVGGSEALFGLKALFKFGPFSLTTLASQKKGTIKTVSVSGGATSSEFNLRAYDYSTNNFFLDTVYASEIPSLNLFNKYYGSATPIINEYYRVTYIEVWKSVSTTIRNNSKERQANAYINLPALKAGQTYDDIDSIYRQEIKPIPGQSETGRFILLTPGVDYVLHPETGFITFKTQVQETDIIAVAYRQEGDPGPNNDLYYGELLSSSKADTTQKLVLKLVKPANLQPQYTEAWKLMLKNIYPVGGRNIKKDGFEFNIKYEKTGQDPVIELPTASGTVKLLNAFGLDNVDAANNPNPDDKFDFRPGITIIPETGEVIFPTLQPFGADFNSKLPDSLKFQDVYDTTKTFARQNTVRDKWELVGKYSGEATSTYQLGFNIVENSVRVYLNGNPLKEGVDYLVDYNIGQLTIRNDAALVPGADLKISYEQNDLFQLASKTLLGARGLLEISPRTQLGFSILNLNQQSLTQKVRIGEEPLSNTIMGVDFKTSADLPIITNILDKLISTREMSTINLSGEYAYMKPDPNTIKSTIPDDNGQSVAYIDDFEGSKRIIPVGLNYTGWKDISPPAELPTLPLNTSFRSMMDYKGKSFWYSLTPSNVSVPDIWGSRKKVARQDQQVAVLDYYFIPDSFGTYNYYPNLKGDKTKDWGGMMRLLSTTANNLVEENVQFIEFWLNISEAPKNAKLFIDLGRISEDVIPNNKLDTEDKNFNDVLEPGEDTGIDGLTDSQEGNPALNPNLYKGPPTNNSSDPSGDDFSFRQTQPGVVNPMDYYNINGTEGNAQLSDIGRIPDTEDLNRNGNLDLVNSFFRYEIPLDTNTQTNKFNQGTVAGKGWYFFRIPLKDTSQQVGNPSFSTVETIRLFVTGVTSQVHVRLAEFNLVGNQWQKVLPQDTTMEVSVINIEDNANYTSPPGVFQQRDQTRPDEQVYGNEQSLDLKIINLPVGQAREAVKYLTAPLDVFNYSQMKLFIHGDENTGIGSVSSSDPKDYNSEVYFRFGIDTNNFYEYRQPVRPGWNDIAIKFSDLTAIKEARDSVNQLIRQPVPGSPGSFYSLRGNPTLTLVKFLLVGIYNKGSSTSPTPVSGEVWVNELRVIGADNHPGWAYSFASSLHLADLGNINFNIQGKSPFFHQLSDRFGNRIQTKNWSLSADLDVLRLMPFNLPGSSFKLNYSHTESLGEPLYLPGTDILVSQAAQQLDTKRGSGKSSISGASLIEQSKTVSLSDSWSATNVRIKIPTNLWWLNDTFNSLSYGFSYNFSSSSSPTVQSNRGWLWLANINYGLNLSQDYYFKPADIPVIGTLFGIFSDYRDAKIYYLPQSIAWSITARRTRNSNIPRPQGNSAIQPIISRDFTTTRNLNLSWKMSDGGLLNLSTDYNFTINSSLANYEVDAAGNQRSESSIWRDIFSGKTFGKDFQYQQTLNLQSAPQLPRLWDIYKYFTLTAGYSVSYQWSYDFRQQQLGRSAGFNNRTSFGLSLKWKALTAPLFAETKAEEKNKEQEVQTNVQQVKTSRSGRIRVLTGNEELDMRNILKSNKDTTNVKNENVVVSEDTTSKGIKIIPIKRALFFLRDIAKSIFFDYESINFNFSSSNNISKTGLRANSSGFSNFFGIKFNPANGPSRSFMLGLDQDAGPRAPNGNLQDVFSQQNSLDFGTSRPLWSGARIDLKWQVGWSISKSTTLTSDANGNTAVSYISSTGSISRSFLSFPPVLFLKGFNSGIKKVHDLYNPLAADPAKNLSDAFVHGFESLPLASKLGFLSKVMNYIPRPNWHITWDGLQNLFFLKKITDNVSLDHAYTSTYTEGWIITPDGTRQTQTQRVQYGFAPLIGLNFTFARLWNGVLVSSIKYSTRTSFDLGISTRNVIESFSKDFGITAGYSKSGFEIPLFGVSLKNDIEFSFSYTNTRNSSIIYDMINFNENGVPQDGTTRVTIEPRVKYTISSRVQLTVFYTRTTVNPEGASRIPPSVQNIAGLDVHISIQ